MPDLTHCDPIVVCPAGQLASGTACLVFAAACVLLLLLAPAAVSLDVRGATAAFAVELLPAVLLEAGAASPVARGASAELFAAPAAVLSAGGGLPAAVLLVVRVATAGLSGTISAKLRRSRSNVEAAARCVASSAGDAVAP